MMNYLKSILKSEIKTAIVLKRIWQWTGIQLKYLKTKIKPHKGKLSTDFQDDGIAKDGSYCICPSVILIGSVLKISKNYCPRVFLEECKYTVKEKR